MQFVENLSDCQAVDAVRDRISWKYALGLEIDDQGFDFSVLSEFRDRLLQGSAEHRLLDVTLTRLKEKGLLKVRGRQRTDATHVLAHMRVMRRLEMVGEALRATLNALAAVDPHWLKAQVTSDWFERYSRRVEDTRFPTSQEGRLALAETYGCDGIHLLQAVYSPEPPPGCGIFLWSKLCDKCGCTISSSWMRKSAGVRRKIRHLRCNGSTHLMKPRRVMATNAP